MSKFLKPKAGVVYHCIPVQPMGDYILPSDKGGDITADTRNQLGVPLEGKIPLIYASAYITKAMAFGMQGSLQEKFLNTSIDGSNGEIILACDRKKMMERERNVTIFEMPDKGFVTLDYKERQCVSAEAVPFSSTKIAFRANSTEDLMRGGLQILAFNETYIELMDSEYIVQLMKEEKNNNAFFKIAANLIREGKLVWENKERNINPDPILAKKLNIELKASRISPVKNININSFKK